MFGKPGTLSRNDRSAMSQFSEGDEAVRAMASLCFRYMGTTLNTRPHQNESPPVAAGAQQTLQSCFENRVSKQLLKYAIPIINCVMTLSTSTVTFSV